MNELDMNRQFFTLHIKDYSALYRRQVDTLSFYNLDTVFRTEET